MAQLDHQKLRNELAEVEDRVDHAATELWGLTDAEFEEICYALELLRERRVYPATS